MTVDGLTASQPERIMSEEMLCHKKIHYTTLIMRSGKPLSGLKELVVFIPPRIALSAKVTR